MNVREMMNNNPAMVTIGAVVILVLCLGAIMCQLKGPSRPSGPIEIYFYDTGADTLFTATSDQNPPIPAPSDAGNGTAGVRAHVFGCGDCPSKLAGLSPAEVETRGAFIAYLERYTPEAKAAMERAMDSDDPETAMMYEMDQGRQIRLLDSDQWIDANSEQGMNVYSTIRDRCAGEERAKQCFPNR